jgi:predicted MFS family arabinose efflux permease
MFGMNAVPEAAQQSGSSTLPAPPGRSFQLLLLTVATFAGVYARTAVSPLQETMRTALSLTDNQMALLQGPALALPVAIAATPIGLAIDRYSRVRLMLIFAACNFVGSLFTALAANFTLLFAARCLVGVAGPASWMAAMSLLADLYAPTQRGRANMVVVVGQCAGNSAAFALGGVLQAMGDSWPNDWRYAMLWMAVPLGAVVLLTLAMREPQRTELVIQKPSARRACAELWRYRAVIAPLLVGLSMLGVAEGAAVTWVAPTLSRSFALSPDRIGVIMGSVLLVSGVLGPIAGGILADVCQRRGGPRRTMSVLSALALLTVPAGLFALTASAASASALLFVFMAVGGAIVVAGTTLFTIVIPNELRGLCMAVLSAAFLLLGFGLAPLTVSLLSGAIGGPAMIGEALAWVCATTSLFATAVFAFGIRYFPRAL